MHSAFWVYFLPMLCNTNSVSCQPTNQTVTQHEASACKSHTTTNSGKARNVGRKRKGRKEWMRAAASSSNLAKGVVCHTHEALSNLNVAAVKEIFQVVPRPYHEFHFLLFIANQPRSCSHKEHNTHTRVCHVCVRERAVCHVCERERAVCHVWERAGEQMAKAKGRQKSICACGVCVSVWLCVVVVVWYHRPWQRWR